MTAEAGDAAGVASGAQRGRRAVRSGEGRYHITMTPQSECGGDHELFGVWPYGGEAWADSFEFEFEDRYWEDPQNAFTLDIEGELTLDFPAYVTFQIAADDAAVFHVGNLTFSANGEDGESGTYHEGAEVSGMLMAGTHQIRGHYVNEGGVASLKVLRWEITPLLAQFQVENTEIEVPWARGESGTPFTLPDAEFESWSEIQYEVVAANGTTLPDWVRIIECAGMQVDNQGFLETGLDSTTIQLALRQTYRGYAVDTAPVSVRVWRKPLPDAEIRVDENNDGEFDAASPDTALLVWTREPEQEGHQRLLDFSPIQLKLGKGFVEQLNLERVPDTFRVILKSDAAPLNVLWTGMEGAYEPFYRSDVDTCGPTLDALSTTFPIQTTPSGEGLDIPLEFLKKAQASGGILMAEAPTSGAGSLTLAVHFAGSPIMLFEKSIPISSVPVKDMFVRVNLRENTPPAIAPENLPAITTNATCALYFLHGFHVNEANALKWQKEMFRRLYRKNCRALFYGITWAGNQGVTGLDYHASVEHSFVAGERLAAYVAAQNAASGSLAPTNNVFMAHSLGNMVVASAIQDHGLTPAKVIMLNAAIPSEAINEATFNASPRHNGLVPDDWKEYLPITWCSCWYQLWGGTLPQGKLTWRNRFSKLMEQDVLNLYSTGDEVLEVGEQEPSFWEDGLEFEWHSWQAQELGKGKGPLNLYGSTVAGWDFRFPAPSAETANAYTLEELRFTPAFNIDSRMLASSISTNDWNMLLAHGIPALSCPVGNPEQHAGTRAMIGVNLNEAEMKANGWKEIENETDLENNWLHSDIKNADYFYTWRAFERIANALP